MVSVAEKFLKIFFVYPHLLHINSVSSVLKRRLYGILSQGLVNGHFLVADKIQACGQSGYRSQSYACADVSNEASVGGNSVIRQYARVEDCVTVIDSDVGGYVCLFGTCYVKGAEKILDFNARPSRICCPEDLEEALNAVEEARAEKLESYLPSLS